MLGPLPTKKTLQFSDNINSDITSDYVRAGTRCTNWQLIYENNLVHIKCCCTTQKFLIPNNHELVRLHRREIIVDRNPFFSKFLTIRYMASSYCLRKILDNFLLHKQLVMDFFFHALLYTCIIKILSSVHMYHQELLYFTS